MSTKILIDAADLWRLLEKHPEVEIDILKNAAPQIATRLQEKVSKQTAEIEASIPLIKTEVKAAIDSQMRGLAASYRMGDDVKGVIRLFLKNELREEIRVMAAELAREMVAEAVRGPIAEALGSYRQALADDLVRHSERTETEVRAAAEREVLALMRGYRGPQG